MLFFILFIDIYGQFTLYISDHIWRYIIIYIFLIQNSVFTYGNQLISTIVYQPADKLTCYEKCHVLCNDPFGKIYPNTLSFYLLI